MTYNLSNETLKRNNDFGTANRAAALIRKLLVDYARDTWDKTFTNRLRSEAIRIVNAGNPELKGNLQFTDGDVRFLQSVEFNTGRKLDDLLNFEIDVKLKNSDALIITVPKIEDKYFFKRPYYAKSLLIRFICSIVHFDLEKGGSTCIDDLEIFIGKPFPGARVKVPLQSAETSVIMVTMCAWCMCGTPITSPKWFAGRVIATFNLLDGKTREFKYTKETIKIRQKPEGKDFRRKGELGWEIE